MYLHALIAIQVSLYRLRTFFRYGYCETFQKVTGLFSSSIFIARVLSCVISCQLYRRYKLLKEILYTLLQYFFYFFICLLITTFF